MADVYALDIDGTIKLGGSAIYTETLEGLAANGSKVVVVSPSISCCAFASIPLGVRTQ